VTAVAHRVVDPVALSGPRQTIESHVDHPAPAVVDADLRKLGKHLTQIALQDPAALDVRVRVGDGESRPAAEQQPVVRRDAEVVHKVLCVRRHPPTRQDPVEDINVQRLRDDNEGAYRHDAASKPAERADPRNPARDEHLIRVQASSRRDDLMPAAWRPSQPRDRGVLVDLRPPSNRSFRQAGHEPTHMHPGALLKDHPAEIALRAQLGRQVGGRDDAGLRIGFCGENLLRSAELGEMLGLRRQLELAGAREAAVDALFADQPLHEIHAGVEAMVEPGRTLAPQLCRHGGIVLGKAVVAHAAVAAGRGVPDGLGFEEHDARTLLGERERGRTAGQAATDHRYVAAALHRSCSGTTERLRGVQPIRGQLHGGPSGVFERSIAISPG
jgi:hypothetical protein